MVSRIDWRDLAAIADSAGSRELRITPRARTSPHISFLYRAGPAICGSRADTGYAPGCTVIRSPTLGIVLRAVLPLLLVFHECGRVPLQRRAPGTDRDRHLPGVARLLHRRGRLVAPVQARAAAHRPWWPGSSAPSPRSSRSPSPSPPTRRPSPARLPKHCSFDSASSESACRSAASPRFAKARSEPSCLLLPFAGITLGGHVRVGTRKRSRCPPRPRRPHPLPGR
jgi:hypothetical protein